MDKENFLKLESEQQHGLVVLALCNLILYESYFPSTSKSFIQPLNYEIIKIILGLFKDGCLVFKEV